MQKAGAVRMGEINYYKARSIIPYISQMEKIAEGYRERYDPKKEPDLYLILHDPDAPRETKDWAVKELTEPNMCLVFNFLKSFRYCVEKAEIMEDLIQEGFKIIMEAIPQWDVSRGSFRGMVREHLKKLYRAYYSEVTLRPQTGLQNDARIKKYDNDCLVKEGRLESAEKVAEALNTSVKMVKAARDRNMSFAGTVESIEKLQQANPSLDFYSVAGQITEDTSDQSLLDKELIREARDAIKDRKYEERLIFDFLIMPGNWDLPGKEFSEVVRKATGYNFSYQQIYRAKQNIGATLIHKGVLERSLVESSAKRLDAELKRREDIDARKKKKWAYLFADDEEEED